MARPSKTSQELGYLNMFWKEVRICEADFLGLVSISLHTAIRPGVVVLRLSFTSIVDEASKALGSQSVQVEFPNGSTQTLAGALWSASIKLTQLVADDYHSRNGRTRRGA